MSDGQRSGKSTGRVSCKSTELKRCSMIEMRWNKLLLLISRLQWPTYGSTQLRDLAYSLPAAED